MSPIFLPGDPPMGSGSSTTLSLSENAGLELPIKLPDEPIAIVGMAFQLPQEATTEEGLWDMLLKKRNAMTDFPSDRVNIDSFYHPDRRRPDTLNCRGGHFLAELPSAFDAPFFSITAAEAEAMDPQQRLVLETTYHALENAGLSMEHVSGTRTSVHAGSFSDDYKHLELREPEKYPSYACSGVAQCMLSNRISWFFNLQSASVTVDTACSSSMTALDIACQGLRGLDADTGIVIGSNLILGLELSLTLSNMNFLSPDSKCYSFDHRANGYGRGEGVGVLIVKRLSTAIQSGDTIRAVIRATGSGQDGWTPGITQPSATSQERLIRATYAKNGLDMSVTSYVEAHGTGTAVGDPIEATAIGNAFKQYRSPLLPLYIGSIKSNLGHLEGCSGIAGVIKTVLMLEKGVLAPNANFEKLSPAIDAEKLHIKVVAEPIPWPTRGLRRASVSSFGFGGANSHIVLDDAFNYLRLHDLRGNHCTSPAPPKTDAILDSGRTTLFPLTSLHEPGFPSKAAYRKRLVVLTAADQEGVHRVAAGFNEATIQRSRLSTSPEDADYLDDLAYTLCERRSLLNWRSFAIIDSVQDLMQLSQKVTKPVKRSTAARLAYVFTGQGAQYAKMVDGLLRFPVFAASLQRSEMYLDQLGCQWSLIDELSKSADITRVNEPGLSQPLCTALQIGIVDLLHFLGVCSSVVVGHSSGEIAAAYSIGAIPHSSACKIAYFRGLCADDLLSARKPQDGSRGMMAVGLSHDEVMPYIDQVATEFGTSKVVVACINSPTSITASGDIAQLERLEAILSNQKIFARKLRVNIAYHSPQMSEIAARYLGLLGSLEAGAPDASSPTMISSVTGETVSPEELQTAQYWVSNMVQTVRFSDALTVAYRLHDTKSLKPKISVRKAAFHDVLEIGPHGALRGPILDTLRHCGASKVSYLSAMDRTLSGDTTLFDLAGKLFCKGHDIMVSKINHRSRLQDTARAPVPHLPRYSFDHSRHYWREPRAGKEGYRLRNHARLDLLGTPSPNWSLLEPRWTCLIRVTEQPWVLDHKIKNSVLYPASGMVAMALEAVKQVAPSTREISGFVVKDTTFARPIIVPEDDGHKEVEIVLRPSDNANQKTSSTWDFKIRALESDGDWQEKCTGVVSAQYRRPVDVVDGGREARARQIKDTAHLRQVQERCNTIIDPSRFYTALEDKGFEYGQSFQCVSSIRSDDDELASADLDVYRWPVGGSDGGHRQDHVMHPTTLDAIFQLSFAAASKGHLADVPSMLPSRLSRLWIRNEGVSHPMIDSIHACLRTKSIQHRFITEAFAVDPASKDTILALDFECSSIDVDVGTDDGGPESSLCYEMQWKPDLDLMDSKSLSRYCHLDRFDPTVETDFYDNVDYLVMSHLSDAIDSLPQSRLDTMLPSLQRYVTWASQMRDRFRTGQLDHCSPSSPVWQAISTDPVRREALSRRMEASEIGNLFAKVASQLPAVLNGDIDAVQFMFQDDKVERFYRSTNRQVIHYEPLRRYLELLSHKTPSLKILEIGAGTGGSTHYVLDMLASRDGLARFSHYDYTDISPAFFEKAAENFAQHAANMDFRVFDAEKDPADQGLDVETYDVVFAASVLHATKNLEQTMRNARRLLKPGGKLIMIEIVEETPRMSFAFGLFPGWWLGEEPHRHLRPWLRIPEWDALMQRTGFSGVDMEIPDFQNNAYHEYSIIIATATEDPAKPTDAPLVSLLVHDDSENELGIARVVTKALEESGQPCETVPWSQIADAQAGGRKHWVSLSEIEHPVVANLDRAQFEALRPLILSAHTVLWVSSGGGSGNRDPRYHAVDGLARAACTENPRLAFATLALEATDSTPELIADKIVEIFNKTLRVEPDNCELEYLEQDGQICIPRVTPSVSHAAEVYARKRVVRKIEQPFGRGPPLALAIGSLGLLDTLHFVEDHQRYAPLPAGYVEVKIDTGGVNFRDCLTALGQLEADYIGVEYAGIVSQVSDSSGPYKVGDRVAGWCKGSYQTYTRNRADLLTPVPDGLPLVEAAASMVVFSTAWHSLVNVARLSKGESVLIHSAAGGTGQAAIQVAKYLGAEAFCTVGSLEKKKFLQDTYAIPEDRIFASRDLTFAEGILRVTNGRGVDVILNSLSGESLLASWECIATCGRFIEIGNRDIHSRSQLPMWPFRKAVLFTHVALYVMVEEQPALLMEVGKTILDLLAKKVFFVPQPLKAFSIADVQEVFRLFQTGNHYGKMVVQMKPEGVVEARVKPKERYHFDASRTYVIAGGLGGLGRSITLWMVEKGARNFVLLSRSGTSRAPAQELVRRLQAANVNVQAPACDIADRVALTQVLSDCSRVLPPIAGCIQAAMVLRDSLLERMTFEDWTTACESKIKGTWNLHTLLPRGLDFFTCLSSLSCIIGNAGQANYAAGNAYMDELVRHRVLHGEAAATINLGWVEKEGVVAENINLKTAFAKVESMPPISMEELYALLDYTCDPSTTLLPPQVITGLAPPRTSIKDPFALEAQVPWLHKRPFRPLLHAAAHANKGTGQNEKEAGVNYTDLFRNSPNIDEAVRVVSQCVRNRLSKALAVAEDDVDMSTPLHAIGVDSLFGIELRNFLAKQFDADVAVFDLMGATSADAACALVANRSRLLAK